MSKSSNGAADANFHALGSKERNKLPDSIKTVTHTDFFKKLVKKYIKATACLMDTEIFLIFDF